MENLNSKLAKLKNLKKNIEQRVSELSNINFLSAKEYNTLSILAKRLANVKNTMAETRTNIYKLERQLKTF